MATTYVALLRGINVGKNKRVAMADLRAVIESLGYADARTLLNSGNAVFSSTRALRKNAAVELQDALTKKTGVSSRFILRSAGELDDTVRANTLMKQATDPTRLFALFLADKAHLEKAKPLLEQSWKPEVVAVGPNVVYMWCPNGLLESKAMVSFGRAFGDAITVRNWATVMKIATLVSSS